ncbi:TIGR01906 family membrane protein [Clostridium sp. E02]|uniref:TIGR01906 family membrane protein n=1 Tax=Clostridium sp. E02 TaxID=2487134 RepID=UPI000F54B549|nr:TIGR01906 family membrane protein [Clostridium sp. E02]
MTKVLQYTIGIIFSICLMIVLLFTSVEAAVYWTPGYFEKEYAKYHVPEAVSMTMEDLLDVTGEMMSYLRGNREDLHVETTMGGVNREFFNAREIAHMEDVKGLFLGALSLRRACLLIMAICLLLLILLKTTFQTTFIKSLCIGTGLFFCLIAGIAGIISTDFTKYFILFHRIFFHNDFWMLDPSTDMLINIVPEGFFRDTVFYIGFLTISSVLFILIISFIILRKYRENIK